jgi:hypothetical protein
MSLTRREFPLIAGAAMNLSRAEDLRIVKARRKPNDEWREYATRTLDRVTGFRPLAEAPKTDLYGGRLDRKQRARGFFYPAKLGGRRYLIDPAGNPYIQAGICSLTAGRSATNRKNLATRFGTTEKWAAQTSDMLRSNGFTGSGGWSDVDVLVTAPHRLVYCTTGNFMGDFGRSRHLTHQQAGHLGYANDFIPVFHPDFEAACDSAAQKLAATKEDPFLLGHFSDNELPAPPDLLDRALGLDSDDPGRKAAENWLAARKSGALGTPGDEDREAFRGYVYDRYFQVTTAAIRKYDPNHLCLGPRMHGPFLKSAPVMQAAGKYLDVLSLNVYNYWTPPAELMAMWSGQSGKPFLVTEWYTKGEDSGYPNTSGAGWNVPTQQDRGWFYQNFTLALLESKNCIGWHWFKYLDNDPDDLTTDPSNRDSNKGLVNLRYEPYADLVAAMKSLNANIYALADYFDR